ncbi:MAG: nitroreductase family deazaflavin-dependent oxidoreductase [Chloroflexi bacterium]|nr:nitroreductase family deazaflavin-dependent oxidoreductase [Chloroflexota bacterium]
MSTQDIQTDLSKPDQTVEITTTGRRTGRLHRIEVRLHNVGGRLFITGNAGKPRDWYANMRVSAAFTLHLKQNVAADLEATATPIVDDAERRSVLRPLLEQSGHLDQIEARLASSPLVRVDVTL